MRDGAAMLILICGDFSGRASRGLDDPGSLASRPTRRIDVDNFDATMTRLAPAVDVTIAGRTLPVAMAEMDDFYPDRLFERVDVFSHLRGLRERLRDPARFEQASAELLGGGTSEETDEATRARLLGGPAPAARPNAGGALDGLLRAIVAPHIVADPAPRQAQYVSAVDLAIGEPMRALLHDPGFQDLEAAWRSVQMLVSRADLDETTRLHLFDVTRGELLADTARPDLDGGGLWKALVERQRGGAGGSGWAMVVGLDAFGPSGPDVSLLASMATISAASGPPFVATAAPSLFGCTSIAASPEPTAWHPLDTESLTRWQALRRSELAPWIGLLAPRVLLRLPYGKSGESTTAFEFEEMAGADPARGLLWGHPGATGALLALQAFAASGWDLSLDDQLDVGDLPAWVTTQDGERKLHPCAEAFLGERAAQALIERGLMPLLSRRDRAAVRLLRWQSIAEPPRPLNGPWA